MHSANKKIGLVTFWRMNYGSILQCYATMRYIRSKGYDVVLLSDDPQSKTSKAIAKIGKYCRTAWLSIGYRGYLRQFLEIRKSEKNAVKKLSRETSQRMDEFSYQVLKPEYHTFHAMRRIARHDQYVAFFTGSDQVWNGSRPFNKLYFLVFAPKMKRVAWMPSFGVKTVEAYNIRKFRRAITSFATLAVRERTGVETIKNLTSRSVEQLLDPVTLMSPPDWVEFASKAEAPSGDFVFVHFLDEPNDDALRTIRRIHNETKMRVVSIACMYNAFDEFKFVDYRDVSPWEYVKYIDTASVVITDSFHTMLFSSILNKSFYVFERQYTHSHSEESRITDLLDLFGLDDRFVKTKYRVDEMSIQYGILCTDWEKSKLARALRENAVKTDQYFERAMLLQQTVDSKKHD